MPLANKPLNEITESDLQELIDNQVAEGKAIDYKLQLWSSSDADKKEFLADVSSFANTSGGHLIVGMDENQGIPIAIVGLQDDVDAAKLRLENMLRDGIAPRIQSIGMQPVPVPGGNVLIIRIPQSWSSPHMVTFAGNSKFYGRNSAGKYQLDVNELRSAFTLSETVTERIRNFRLDRIAKIAADDTPIKLSAGAKLVLHVVPIGAFTLTNTLSSLSLDKRTQWLHKFGQAIVITSHRYNADGLLYYGTSIGSSLREKYIQIFRNGAIEFTDTWLLNEDDKFIPGAILERKILDLFPILLSVQAELDVQPPMIVMLTLLGVRGYGIGGVTQFSLPIPYSDHSIDQDDLLIPDTEIEDFNAEPSQSLRPLFDTVWQACGLQRSRNYDQEGKWKSSD